ncbi:MAG TPA: diacylglycerol kinase family protein [Gemmatimonadales bacterium]
MNDRDGLALVLNPGSGGASGEATPERVVRLFEEHGREARVVPIGAGADIGAAARQAVEDGCSVLVAGGGDGTVSAAAGALVGTTVPLGVLPLGTLNHFAKDLGIPLELAEAVGVVARGRVREVDVGEVNGRIFLNNSSLGVYPRIVELRSRHGGRGPGKWIAALWATLAVLRRHPFLTVRIRTEDEEVVRRTPFVFVGNNEYRMTGLHPAARESLDRGVLAVYVMDATRRRSLLRLGWDVLRLGPDGVGELDLLRVTEAVVETGRSNLKVALDGEVAGLAAPLRYRSRAGALRVIAV